MAGCHNPNTDPLRNLPKFRVGEPMVVSHNPSVTTGYLCGCVCHDPNAVAAIYDASTMRKICCNCLVSHIVEDKLEASPIVQQLQKLEAKIQDEINSRVAQVDVLHEHVENIKDRIKQLESQQEAAANSLAQRINDLNSIVETLNANVALKCHTEEFVRVNFEILSERINELENHVKSMTEAYLKKVIKNAVPHKCPPCDGTGNSEKIVRTHPDFAFYAEFSSCIACEGKGILWG